MKKITFIAVMLFSTIGKAQMSDIIAVPTQCKDTLYMLSADPVSFMLSSIWAKEKNKPVIIYVSYDRLFSEYIKQNWGPENVPVAVSKINPLIVDEANNGKNN